MVCDAPKFPSTENMMYPGDKGERSSSKETMTL